MPSARTWLEQCTAPYMDVMGVKLTTCTTHRARHHLTPHNCESIDNVSTVAPTPAAGAKLIIFAQMPAGRYV